MVASILKIVITRNTICDNLSVFQNWVTYLLHTSTSCHPHILYSAKFWKGKILQIEFIHQYFTQLNPSYIFLIRLLIKILWFQLSM